MLHKLATTRWRIEWSKTLDAFAHAKNKEEFERALERISKFEEAARKGFLSQRYLETPQQLLDRALSLTLREMPVLVREGVGPKFKRNAIFLPSEFTFSDIMHEFFEAKSFKTWRERFRRWPLQKRRAALTASLSHLLGSKGISRPAVETVAIDNLFSEPLTHLKGVLKKEKDFVRFYMLHPNSQIADDIESVLLDRKAPLRTPAWQYLHHGKLNVLRPRGYISEWDLAGKFPSRSIFIHTSSPLYKRRGSIKHIDVIGKDTVRFLRRARSKGYFTKVSPPLLTNVFLYTYSLPGSRKLTKLLK